MKLEKSDFENVLKIIVKHTYEKHSLAESIRKIINAWTDEKTKTFADSPEFFRETCAENKYLMKSLREYFLEKYQTDIAKIYEDKSSGHYWNPSVFIGYANFVKEGLYYPEAKDKLKKIIKEKGCSSAKDFWLVVSLCGVVKDDFEASQSFAHVVTEKSIHRNLSLLDLEKLQKAWNRRFKNVDVTLLDPVAVEGVKKVFEKINVSKNKDLYEFKSGHYTEVILNADLLSQENKLSIPKNIEALRIFFHHFQEYVKEYKTPYELYSITGFEVTSNMETKLRLNYENLESKDKVTKLFKNLLGFCLLKEKENLKGKTFDCDDMDKFFDSFLLSISLEDKMPNKEDHKKTKFKL